jgi:hypothetical protein
MLSGNLKNIFSVFSHFEKSISKKQLLNYYIPILGEREITSIIKLLEILRIFKIEDGILNKVYFNISESRLKSIFINNLSCFTDFEELIELLVYDTNSKKFRVVKKHLKSNFDFLLSIFITLKLCEKDLNNYFLLAIPEHKIFESPINGLSQKQLDKILLAKKINGVIAEKFVVNYEISRVLDCNLVKHASIHNVSLGYDISSIHSLNNHAPIFIEVKSFNFIKHFFWSENEISVSKKLGDDYFLYLIKIENKQPKIYQIIQNPYEKIINSLNYKYVNHSLLEIFF